MLPQVFIDRMKDYLGSDFPAFLNTYDNKPSKGIRINPLKATADLVGPTFDTFQATPYSPYSFSTDTEKVGLMPLHSAGAFYSQEPSASSAVTVLDPQPGDKVLDLCAAPGGKSTQIAGLLQGQGLLWSNEIVRNRANILLSNIERMGIRNAVVSSAHPDQLCTKLAGFFDKIMVDAPCSGEGMFRKNPLAITEWSPEHVTACAQRQSQILDSACQALRPGGVMVYSTCTFAKEENEDVCTAFLERHPEFSLVDPYVNFGSPAIGIPALRMYPTDGGEGHFVAKFQKNDGVAHGPNPFHYPKETHQQGADFYRQLFGQDPFGTITTVGDKLLILPDHLPDFKGLSLLRAGVELGEVKGSRIEPSHNVFMVQSKSDCPQLLDFQLNDPQLYNYLHGLEVPCPHNGYTAVSVLGVTLGFGKASNGMLKNKYPKGLRYK